MLDQFIADTRNVSELQYQGPSMTKEQRLQEIKGRFRSFDQQFHGVQVSQARPAPKDAGPEK
jgi:hypothetical protein